MHIHFSILLDTDECSKYTSICGSKDCFNTEGSYRCLKKCSSGFTRVAHGDCRGIVGNKIVDLEENGKTCS